MRKRVKKTFRKIRGLDAILVQNTQHSDANFFYFTGIGEGLFENASAILKPPDDLELITYILEKESATGGDYDLTLHEERDGTPLVLDRLQGYDRVGVNMSHMPVAKYKRLEKELPEVEFVDVSDELNEIRLVKDRQEISRIRKACRIASRVADGIPGMLKEGMTETELAAEITHDLLFRGAAKLSFFTIACFGPNSAIAHHVGDETKLRRGDFVLCDFGGSVDNYASDITRTCVFGKATKKQKKIYRAVKRAQGVGLRAIKEGINGKEVHRRVSTSISMAGYKGKFTHSTGHAMGIDVHDCGAAIHSEIDLELKRGMVFTVEPGIYLSGYGGVRIEDDVVVRKDGVEVLTDAGKDLIEVTTKR